MSTLSVTTVSSANGSTDLTVRSGNVYAGAIVFSANGNGFVLQGNSSTNTMVVNSSAVTYNLTVTYSTVNAASFAVGSNFVANTTTLNANGFVANSTGVYDSSDNLRSIPVSAKSTSYVLTSSDNGKTVSTNAGVTVNGAVLTTNQIFTVFNNSSANITITIGTGGTMYQAGTANTGNRTLQQYGVATILMVASNTFVISGAGLS